MPAQVASLARPPITLIDAEADALFGLAWAARGRSQMSATLLLEELSRAEVCDRASVPPDVVTMKSTVAFCDEHTGEGHKVELVYPRDADMAQGRLSVLTPVGAALIGLRSGSSIEWPDRRGAFRRYRVDEVVQPPRDG